MIAKNLQEYPVIATLPAPAPAPTPATYSDSLESDNWMYGAPHPTIKCLIHRRTQFLPHWQEHQATLNALPQFTHSIEVDRHGWSGYFNEVSKLLPFLAACPPTLATHLSMSLRQVYHALAAPTKTGFAVAQYAEV
ncbi:hypothetical protein PHLCEN_2v1128 [Hermanssonia centrifuga]|uniref:Uncharacterized protein n=1 Tax=Hermanssonia centrifuga TaxID=98765 RepID=A0A2R6S4E8_9APHY|nr:hypothetical protein PHLCEN_2v1128 [Hermanssonia centrifuga]